MTEQEIMQVRLEALRLALYATPSPASAADAVANAAVFFQFLKGEGK